MARSPDEPSSSNQQLWNSSTGVLAEAIVRTIQQPLLVLSGNLTVIAANPAFYGCFRVLPEDTIGCRIYDLGDGQWDIPELRQVLEEILTDAGTVENYRVQHDFEQLGRRTIDLNAHRINRGGGIEDRILLALSDVTDKERALFELQGQKEFAEKLVNAVRDPLLVLGWDLRVKSANEPFYEAFRVDRRETIGRLVYELGNGQWNIPALRKLLEDILPQHDSFDDYVVEHDFEHIGRRVMVLNARRLDHIDLIVLAIEDVTERRRTETRQTILMGELQHRVKNILMNVRALSRQTRLGSKNLLRFSEVFDGRLDSLARTQDLLVKNPTAGVMLPALLRLELHSVGAREGTKFTLDGPDTFLTAEVAQPMAMMVHELTTNAAKYGALSVESGCIEITWAMVQQEGIVHLQFRWRERGVAVRTSRKRGFGSEIIENSLPYLFGGSSRLTFHKGGAECVVELPLPSGE